MIEIVVCFSCVVSFQSKSEIKIAVFTTAKNKVGNTYEIKALNLENFWCSSISNNKNNNKITKHHRIVENKPDNKI